MGKGSGGNTNTTTSTSTPNPAALANYQNVSNQAAGVASNPYYWYSGDQVAGLNSDQLSGIGAIGNFASAMQNPANTYGMASPYINSGAGLTSAAANAYGSLGNSLSALENPNNTYGQATPYYNAAASSIAAGSSPITAADINQYMNPYLQQVGQTTSAEMNQNNAIQQQNLLGNAAASGALGGDRVGLAQSSLANQQNLAENATLANINSQGYNSALGAAQTTNSQQLQAGSLYGQLGQTAENSALAALSSPFSAANTMGSGYLNAGSQMGNLGQLNYNAATGALNTGMAGAGQQIQAGSLEQQQQQNELNAAYGQWLGSVQYPYQDTSYLAGIQSNLGSLMGGSSTTTPPSPSSTSQGLGSLIGGLGSAGQSGLFSGLLGGGGGGISSTGGSTGWINGIKTGGRVERAEGGHAQSIGPVIQDEIGDVKNAGYIGNTPQIARGPGAPSPPPVVPSGGGQTESQVSGFSSVPDAMKYVNGHKSGGAVERASGGYVTGAPPAAPSAELMDDYQLLAQLAPGAQLQKIQYQAPQGVYARGGSPVGPTAPEGEGDVTAQMHALADPKSIKHAVFLAAGTRLPDQLPPGARAVRRPEGTLVSDDPDRLSAFAKAPRLTQSLMAKLLDYPQDKDQAVASGNAHIVSARDHHGVGYETAVSPAAIEEALMIAKQHLPHGEMRVESAQDALKGRQERGGFAAGGAPAVNPQGMQGISGLGLLSGGQNTPPINYGATNPAGTWSGQSLAAAPQISGLALPSGQNQTFSAPTTGGLSIPTSNTGGNYAALTGIGAGQPVNPQTGVPNDYSAQVFRTSPYYIPGTEASKGPVQGTIAPGNAIGSTVGSSSSNKPSTASQVMSGIGDALTVASLVAMLKRGGRAGYDAGGTVGDLNEPFLTPDEAEMLPTGQTNVRGQRIFAPAVQNAPGFSAPPAGITETPLPPVAPASAAAPITPEPQNAGGFNAAPAPALPRGVRDNNPLNLNYVPGQPGLDPSSPKDGAEARFASPTMGIAASTQQLLDYQSKGIDTPAAIASTWTGGNASPQYVQAISAALGVKPTDPINVGDPMTMKKVIAAMVPFETPNGADPKTIDMGVNLGFSTYTHPSGAQASDATYGPGFSSAPNAISPFVPPAQAVQAANTSNQPIKSPDVAPTTKLETMAESPWAALARAGFSMMAGTSPFAAVNIGNGLLAGSDYARSMLAQQRARQQMQFEQAQRGTENTLAQRAQGIQGGSLMEGAQGNAVAGANALPSVAQVNAGAAVGAPGAIVPPIWSGVGSTPTAPTAPTSVPGAPSGTTQGATNSYMGPNGQPMSWPQAVEMSAAYKESGNPALANAAAAWDAKMAPVAGLDKVPALTAAADASNVQQQQLDEMMSAASKFLTGPTAGIRAEGLKTAVTALRAIGINVPAGLSEQAAEAQIIPKIATTIQASLGRMSSDQGGSEVMQMVAPAVPSLLNTREGIQKLTRLYGTLNQRTQQEANFVANAVQSGQMPYTDAVAAFNAKSPPAMWASHVDPLPMPGDSAQMKPGYAYTSNGRAGIWTGNGWAPIGGGQ